ncbi:MAG: Glu-tRNA(Gln) amidotransferase subunit GatD [archaeon]
MKTGDLVRIKTKKREYEGTLIPRPGLEDDTHIVLKLDNGYNIGLPKSSIVSTQVLKKGAQGHSVTGAQKKRADNKKPQVSIVSTGGTITSKVDYKTGGVFPAESAEDLVAKIPELANHASIKSFSKPFQLLSEDMTSGEWAKIAGAVAKELNSGAKGVIVTHGTDTLHYTSAALSFMLRNLSKPVAVVGAQRSTDRGSFDGAQNLLCATHYALSDIAEVSIVMHGTSDDEYCIATRGTKVRKMHSSRRDAFRPVNDGPLAKIFPDGNIIIENTEHNARYEGKVELDDKFEEKVALIYQYPGSLPDVLDYYVSKGYKGIIIAGTGFGHVATQPLDKKKSWIPNIKSAVKKGVFVGVTTQTLYGTTDPYVYSAGRLMQDAGAVFLKDLLPETAYVKLGWVLGHKNWDVKSRMLENIAGEFNERIDPKAFLN